MEVAELSIYDAFKALNEIDESFDDAIRRQYGDRLTRRPSKIKEAVDVSVTSSEQAEAAQKELADADKKTETSLKVIDVDADTLDHIKNDKDYVGQMIMQCNICRALRFMDVDLLKVSEEDEDVYNIEDECPNCHEAGKGYSVIGQVGKVEKEEEKVEETPEGEESSETETSEEEVKLENDEAASGEGEGIENVETEPEEDNNDEELEVIEDEASTEDSGESGDEEEETSFDETETKEEDDEFEGLPVLGDVVDEDDVKEDDTEDTNEALEEDEEVEEKEEVEEALEPQFKPHIKSKLESIGSLVECFVEGNDLDDISCVGDNEEMLFRGHCKEMPQSLRDSKLVGFNTCGGDLIINIDLDCPGEVCLKDLLDLYTDDDCDISLVDSICDSEVYCGKKRDAIDKYGDCAVWSVEKPKSIQCLSGSCNVAPGFEDKEECGDDDDLINDIIKSNGLRCNKIDNPHCAEYWISESIKNGEDLDIIYNTYVKPLGESLINAFKEKTGYQDEMDKLLAEELNETASRNDDPVATKKLADEQLKEDKAYAVIYGYNRSGKFFALKDMISCRDNKELDLATQMVRSKYGVNGSVYVTYSSPSDIREDDEEDSNLPAVNVSGLDTLSGFEREALRDIYRISIDTANAIQEHYGIEVDPRLVAADIVRDLRLIGGAIDVSELGDSVTDRATASMYHDYVEFTDAVDSLIFMVTGEHLLGDNAQKLSAAVRSLRSPAYSTEAINQSIGSPRFRDALLSGQAPVFISQEDVLRLGTTDECLNEQATLGAASKMLNDGANALDKAITSAGIEAQVVTDTAYPTMIGVMVADKETVQKIKPIADKVFKDLNWKVTEVKEVEEEGGFGLTFDKIMLQAPVGLKTDESVQHFKDRKELAEAIQVLKNNNKPYTVKRSLTEGYRYDLVEEKLDTYGVQDTSTGEYLGEVEAADEHKAYLKACDLFGGEHKEENILVTDVLDEDYEDEVIEIEDEEPEVVEDEVTVEAPSEEDEVIEDGCDDSEVSEAASGIMDLIRDEWEAIKGYEDKIREIKDSCEDDEALVKVNKVLEDIENEELVHVGELQKLLQELGEDVHKIADGDEEASKLFNDIHESLKDFEDEEEIEPVVEEACEDEKEEEEVEFDTETFEEDYNNYLKESFENPSTYKTTNGYMDKNGNVLLEGTLTDSNNEVKDIKFALEMMEDKKSYKVTNNLSGEKFLFESFDDDLVDEYRDEIKHFLDGHPYSVEGRDPEDVKEEIMDNVFGEDYNDPDADPNKTYAVHIEVENLFNE